MSQNRYQRSKKSFILFLIYFVMFFFGTIYPKLNNKRHLLAHISCFFPLSPCIFVQFIDFLMPWHMTLHKQATASKLRYVAPGRQGGQRCQGWGGGRWGVLHTPNEPRSQFNELLRHTSLLQDQHSITSCHAHLLRFS